MYTICVLWEQVMHSNSSYCSGMGMPFIENPGEVIASGLVAVCHDSEVCA